MVVKSALRDVAKEDLFKPATAIVEDVLLAESRSLPSSANGSQPLQPINNLVRKHIILKCTFF